MTENTIDLKYNKVILVPTDFSEVCANAIYHGVKLARALGARVCILHIISRETRADLKKKNVGAEYVELRLKEYKRYYEKRYGVIADTLAVEGNIFTTINEVAAETGAYLMVLGTHGKKGLQHVFGSFARRIINEAPIPVVVVQKRSNRESIDNIVFPASNNTGSQEQLHLARAIAGIFNARIHFLYRRQKGVDLQGIPDDTDPLVSEIFKDAKTPLFATVPGKLQDFTKEVISYAALQHADMIVAATRPDIDGKASILSAEEEKLLFNEAHIPVVCVNPGMI